MDITWKRKWIFWLLLAVMLLFLPGKTFAAEKESREAEDSYIYHTAFDAKASLKIRHMKDYGVLDYEETVTVEDSCDYLDGDENLDEIQAKITAYDEKVQKVCEGMQVVSGTDTRGIDGDTINILNMKIRKKTDRPLPPDIFIRLTRSGQTGCWKKWRFRM